MVQIVQYKVFPKYYVLATKRTKKCFQAYCPPFGLVPLKGGGKFYTLLKISVRTRLEWCCVDYEHSRGVTIM